jgi:hypothetical protein
VQTGQSMFPRNILPQSSGSKNEPKKKPRTGLQAIFSRLLNWSYSLGHENKGEMFPRNAAVFHTCMTKPPRVDGRADYSLNPGAEYSQNSPIMTFLYLPFSWFCLILLKNV